LGATSAAVISGCYFEGNGQYAAQIVNGFGTSDTTKFENCYASDRRIYINAEYCEVAGCWLRGNSETHSLQVGSNGNYFTLGQGKYEKLIEVDNTITNFVDLRGKNRISEIRDITANVLEILGDVRGLWPFQELTGTTIQDYTNKNHDMTASESVASWDTAPAFKGRSTYYTFNRSDEEMDTVDHADFEFGDGVSDEAFSIIAVLYPSADVITNGGTIIGKYNTTGAAEDREWIFRIENTTGYPQFEVYDESANDYRGREDQTALTANTWTILVVTYNGNEADPNAGINIYKDGAVVDDANHTGGGAYVAMEPGATPVQIGAHLTGVATYGNFYGGGMTWVGVTGKELDADEVWSLTQRLQGLLGV
jgi:hypothetical protein